MADRPDFEEFTERVLGTVESIPPGRAMSYGSIAELLEAGGPRQVGKVMSTIGETVTWWRVVRADGTLPEELRAEAHQHYLEEGTPLRGGLLGSVRIDMTRAAWHPPAGS